MTPRFSGFTLSLTAASAILTLLSSTALAQEGASTWKDKVDVDARVTFQYIAEENTDLGTAGDRDATFSEQFQLLTGVDFTPELYGFFHGRALNLSGDTGFQDDDGEDIGASGGDAFLELRELYLLKKNLFDVTPLSVQVGRQRIREPLSLWWNSDNDLVRVSYNTSLYNGFIAAGEDISSYRNNTDVDFGEDDEDRSRILGESSWQYRYNHFLEGRFIYEDDHSGLEAPGTLVPVNNRDSEDANLTWFGLRGIGEFKGLQSAIERIKYRADLIGVVGDEDQQTTAASASAAYRTVTGNVDRDVRAWAFDGNVILDPQAGNGVVFTLGYAVGSGDDDTTDGTDNEFRQSDLQGGASRTGLERSAQRNYGEVLRPELSNIHVLNAAAGYPVNEATDVGIAYFYYHLDEDATSLRSSGIAAPLNGTDKNVGQELDASLNVDLDDQFNTDLKFVKDSDLRVVVGAFLPGDAYEPADDDAAFRFFSELKFRF